MTNSAGLIFGSNAEVLTVDASAGLGIKCCNDDCIDVNAVGCGMVIEG